MSLTIIGLGLRPDYKELLFSSLERLYFKNGFLFNQYLVAKRRVFAPILMIEVWPMTGHQLKPFGFQIERIMKVRITDS